MILYKYRSLANLAFAIDIILNERLYYSTYDKPNDPFEGLFVATMDFSKMRCPHILAPPFKITSYKDVKELPFDLSTTGICISSSISDVRLWSHYADGHRGIAIEINCSGMESRVHEVIYGDRLPEFGSTILAGPLPADVLSRKTTHWEYEAEHRIICESEYFSVQGKITGIYEGWRISDTHREILGKIASGKTAIYETRLNKAEIKVDPDPPLSGSFLVV